MGKVAILIVGVVLVLILILSVGKTKNGAVETASSQPGSVDLTLADASNQSIFRLLICFGLS